MNTFSTSITLTDKTIISAIQEIPWGNLHSSYILEELSCLSPLFINDRSKGVMDQGPVARKPWQIEERPLTERERGPSSGLVRASQRHIIAGDGWWWPLQIDINTQRWSANYVC